DCRLFRIVQLDHLPQQRFGVLLPDRVGRGGRRRLIDPLPVRNEPFAVAGAVAVLRLPAWVANIESLEIVFLVKQQRVIGLLVGKGLAAGLAPGRAGLDVPLVHPQTYYCQGPADCNRNSETRTHEAANPARADPNSGTRTREAVPHKLR